MAERYIIEIEARIILGFLTSALRCLHGDGTAPSLTFGRFAMYMGDLTGVAS